MIGRLAKLCGKLRANQAGVAAVEFAIWASLILVVVLPGLDIGLYMNHRLKFNRAMEEAAIYVFNTRENVNETTVANYLIASSGLSPAPTVTITCNGGAAGSCAIRPRPCACVSGTSPAPTFTAMACAAACPDGSTAGHYMTIRAVAPYSSLVVPNKYLNGTTMTESATVRIR